MIARLVLALSLLPSEVHSKDDSKCRADDNKENADAGVKIKSRSSHPLGAPAEYRAKSKTGAAHFNFVSRRCRTTVQESFAA